MTPLLEQFLSEAREFLQNIGEKLMELETDPSDAELMTALFRFVHTLKGNSGLFEFPEMTRVLHAAESLLDSVRHGRLNYSQELADRLLDAMDFVGALCDEIEVDGCIEAKHAADSARLAEALINLVAVVKPVSMRALGGVAALQETPPRLSAPPGERESLLLVDIPESVRMEAYRRAGGDVLLHWLDYAPAEDCFFQGDDPLLQARRTPGLLWAGITAREPWPELAQLDAYRCILDFHLLSAAPREELDEHYRHVAHEVRRVRVPRLFLALPQGDTESEPVQEDFVVEALALLDADRMKSLELAARSRLEQCRPELWLASVLRWLLLVMELDPENRGACRALLQSIRRMKPPPWSASWPDASDRRRADGSIMPRPHTRSSRPSRPAAAALTQDTYDALTSLLDVQREILKLPIENSWHLGRLRAVGATLAGCMKASGDQATQTSLADATATALSEASPAALLAWLDKAGLERKAAPTTGSTPPFRAVSRAPSKPAALPSPEVALPGPEVANAAEGAPAGPTPPAPAKSARHPEDAPTGPKMLKVDASKIDRLMNLIGEMVVSKNALPYLAGRAEDVFGVRDLAREIKAQYAVTNRIAEEMQDAIMQVRMLPVSFVFQRFPRLVRDTSHKLGKEVNLVLEGEETEADKNIIESLADPLVHIVRNCLDHGLEQPEARRAAGKTPAGTLSIRASQQSDRVLIEISDDGKGIDPDFVKLKAYERGLIDEAALDKLSAQEAINLVFLPGFSTKEAVTDLSGRGVGMDVVRTAVAKANGTVNLESEKGKGTRIRLSLPLSMAVTTVMVVESDGQVFGVPMDCVVETVRVPRTAIHTLKKSLATVLRGSIVPLKSINTLLGLNAPPKANADDELAVLVVRAGDERLGLLVDGFRATLDIILKPMVGVLAGLSAYSGSALLGDGSVLMVLNVREML